MGRDMVDVLRDHDEVLLPADQVLLHQAAANEIIRLRQRVTELERGLNMLLAQVGSDNEDVAFRAVSGHAGDHAGPVLWSELVLVCALVTGVCMAVYWGIELMSR